MNSLVTIPEASERLGLNPSRVRALVTSGKITGRKVGRQWLLDGQAVEARARAATHAGRPFEARNAWAILLLASGEQPEGLDPSSLSRLRRALRLEGIEALGPRLSKRSETRTFSAHPGEIGHVIDDPDFLPTGISAAASHGFDLLSGAEADGYVRDGSVGRFVKKHALSETGQGNLRLRVVPDKVWPMVGSAPAAPGSAVALDLSEDSDPRSRDAGAAELARIDAKLRSR